MKAMIILVGYAVLLYVAYLIYMISYTGSNPFR